MENYQLKSEQDTASEQVCATPLLTFALADSYFIERARTMGRYSQPGLLAEIGLVERDHVLLESGRGTSDLFRHCRYTICNSQMKD